MALRGRTWVTYILLIFSLDPHMDTINTSAWLSSNPVSRIAIATPQHCYTRMQHVKICTLSDKLCVMLSMSMSTFFMVISSISIRVWYRVHCTNNTVS